MDPETGYVVISAWNNVSSQLMSVLGPTPAALAALARAQIVSDDVIERQSQYYSAYRSVNPVGGVNVGAIHANYQNTIPDPGVLIRSIHQMEPSVQAGDLDGIAAGNWNWLATNLACHGIDVAATDAAMPGWRESASDWRRIVSMAATTLTPEQHRVNVARAETDDEQAVATAGLQFCLRKNGYSRPLDRELIVEPWHVWSGSDAARLKWMELINDTEYLSLLRASGLVRDADLGFFDVLSRPIPDAATLQGWRVRRLWDEDLAARYGLDDGAEASPIGTYFLRAWGVGVDQEPYERQPEGSADWAALGYRAMRRLPDPGTAAILQNRLRPQEGSVDISNVEGVRPWTPDHTRDMLRIAGYPEPVIDQLQAIADQPLNIRVANVILREAVKHPEIARMAQDAYGAGVDWVKEIWLDQGMTDRDASIAAAAVRAQGEDHAMAERDAHLERLRQANRDSYLLQYRLGLATELVTRNGMIDAFYTGEMADQEVAIVKAELDAGIKKAALHALHEAWIEGKIGATQITGELTALGVTEEAAARYEGVWIWERTEKTRMLTTGEILQSLKNGLLSAPLALARLVNLGWSQPDALVEMAQVERDLELSAARLATATATKAATQAAAAHAAQMKAEREAAVAAAKQLRENIVTEKQVQLAAHEKLLANDRYYAAVHADNAAYATADAKGDEEKKAAEISKELAAYQNYLLERLKLIQEGSEIANVQPEPAVGPAPIPQPGAGANASAGTASAAPTEPAVSAGPASGASGPG